MSDAFPGFHPGYLGVVATTMCRINARLRGRGFSRD